MNVRVIRIPLNTTDSSQLTRILHVRGLSDWSIERVAEQHLRRGHVVVLHLEELPESQETQSSLFSLIDSLKASLVARYPEYESNLFTFSTSNYPLLSPSALSHFSVYQMLPPTPQQQTELFQQLLEVHMREKLREKGGLSVKVNMKCVVVVSSDMRWMQKLLAYVSYFSSKILLHKYTNTREGEGSEGAIECEVEEVSAEEIRMVYHAMEAERRRKVDEQTFSSVDGLFYSPTSPADRELFQFDIPPPPLAELFTVCQMCWNRSLCPAVVVLIGTVDANSQRISIITDFLTKISCSQVTETRVILQDESHLPTVFGDPASPVLGGLPLFIEQITNPLMNNPNCGLVVADVSVYGQYALRELLESGQSETHKNQIRKEKILFVLNIPSTSEVTSQISSRAHWIWE
jgi:hypothetical protein